MSIVNPGHDYTFRFAAGDPASIVVAMREARNHIDVAGDVAAPVYTGGHFLGTLTGEPYRSWDTTVLRATCLRAPGVNPSLAIDAIEIGAASGDIFTRVRDAATSAARAVGAVVGAPFVSAAEVGREIGGGDVAVTPGGSPPPGSGGGGLSTGVVIGLVVAGVVVVGYFFREPLLSAAKSGAKAVAA